MITGPWTTRISEILAWSTDLAESLDRTEERTPQGDGIAGQSFQVTVALTDPAAIARYESTVAAGLSERVNIPVWCQAVPLTAPLASGSTAVAIDTTTGEFRAASNILIWQSSTVHEVVELDAVADAQVTLADPTTAAYAAGAWVMPCRSGWCLHASLRRHSGWALADLTLTVAIDDLAAAEGFTADLTHDGLMVLTEPSVLSGDSLASQSVPDVAIQGNASGSFAVVPRRPRDASTQSHRWMAVTPQACWTLRRMFQYLAGRFRSFLVPSWRQDLTVTRAVGMADVAIYVARRNWSAGWDPGGWRTRIGLRPVARSLSLTTTAGDPIVTTAGDPIVLAYEPPAIQVATVTSIDAINATEERLSLSAAAGWILDAGETLCWVDQCRLSSDEIRMEWVGPYRCSVDAGLTRTRS